MLRGKGRRLPRVIAHPTTERLLLRAGVASVPLSSRLTLPVLAEESKSLEWFKYRPERGSCQPVCWEVGG